MKAGVISSRVFNHPLNPHHRMDVAFCRMLDLLEKNTDAADLTKCYLRLKGYYGHPTEGKPLPPGLIKHLNAMFAKNFEDGLKHLLEHVAGDKWANLERLSPENHANLLKLYRGLLDIRRSHIEGLIEELESQREWALRLRDKQMVDLNRQHLTD